MLNPHIGSFLISKPRNPRHLMVTCGDCAVSMDMIKQIDCAHLCVKGAEQRCVKMQVRVMLPFGLRSISKDYSRMNWWNFKSGKMTEEKYR